eukprot:gene30067-36315_t
MAEFVDSYEQNLENYLALSAEERVRTLCISICSQSKVGEPPRYRHALLSQDNPPSQEAKYLILRLVLIIRQISIGSSSFVDFLSADLKTFDDFISSSASVGKILKFTTSHYSLHPTPLQKYVAGMLECYNAGENLWILFSRLLISSDRSALRKRRAREIVPFHQLVQAGIYDASWQRRNVEAVYDNSRFIPSREDHRKLGNRCRSSIHGVLQFLSSLNVSIDEFKALLKAQVRNRRSFAKISVESVYEGLLVEDDLAIDAEAQQEAPIVPGERFELVQPLRQQTAAGQQGERQRADEEEEGNEDGGEIEDMYAVNNVEVDPIVHGDIACKEFLKSTIRKADSSVKKNVESGCMPQSNDAIGVGNYVLSENRDSILRTDQGNRPVLPFQKHAEFANVCDGSPGGSIRRMIDANELPQSVHSFVGGFHTFKEFIQLYCNMFRDSHLQLLVSHWRDTAGKLEWFLHPGDPRQFQMEASQMLLANYTAAVHGTCLSLNKKTVSVEEVERNMLTRAREHGAAFDLYLSFRFLEAIYMMEDSEDSNGVELFMAARKYLTLLGSVSNARNYMNITTAELDSWLEASDAERIAFEKLIYTQKSRKGRPLWSDRFVEWNVREVRKVEGKFWHTGKLSSLEATSMRLKDLFNLRLRGSRRESEVFRTDHNRALREELSASDSAVELTHVFALSYLAIVGSNVWGVGQVRYCKGDGSSQPLPINASLSNQLFNNEFFDLLKTAEARTINYVAAYCCPLSPHFKSSARPDSVASIDTVCSLLSSVQEQKRQKYNASMATNPIEIEKSRVFTKPMCVDELDSQLARQCLPEIESRASLERMPKKALANLLSRARLNRFSKFGMPPFIPPTHDLATAIHALEGAVVHPMLDSFIAGCPSTEITRVQCDILP